MRRTGINTADRPRGLFGAFRRRREPIEKTDVVGEDTDESARGPVGYCDGVKGDRLYGWARDPERPDRELGVEIFIDGMLAGKETASRSRPDLKAAGLGHGRYGWQFALPLDLPVGVPIQILVRSDEGRAIEGGAFNLVLKEPLARGPEPDDAQAGPSSPIRGHCDGLRGDRLVGWAQDVEQPDRSVAVALSLDGQLIAEEIASRSRPDLKAAGIGHGRYGWRFMLPLDLPVGVPIEVLVRGEDGEALEDGAFTLELEEPLTPSTESDEEVAEEDATPLSPIRGHCDGLRGDDLYGWAQDTDNPDVPVVVEVCLNGELACETIASLTRPDLRAAGVKHGRYGWRFALPRDLPAGVPVEVEVRVKDGAPLQDGVFMLDFDPPLAPEDQRRCEAFVLAAQTRHGETAGQCEPSAAPAAHFLLHAPVPLQASNFGRPEYSYAFVRQAFARVLAKLGTVHDVADAATADRLLGEIEGRGESASLFCFAPPHRALRGTRCPVVPVVAWEFPTIPVRSTADDPYDDWRLGLRQCGRAIALSQFAADALRGALGVAFPVAAIPTPSWDRFSPLYRPGATPTPQTIRVDGFVYDSRRRDYAAAATIPFPPDPTEFDAFEDAVDLDGVVFTSIFSPHDNRKNWKELLIAFIDGVRDRADATIVLKMITTDPAVWWWRVHDALNGMAPFACRVVVLHGFLADADFEALIAATHWIVNASSAEGLCMPLIEYMSAGKPAIAPRHTAMMDYVTPENALVVDSSEEPCGFPHEEGGEWSTTRHRIALDALAGAVANGYRIARDLPDDYARRAAAAHDTMRDFCSEAIVAAQLDSFLGLNLSAQDLGESPSRLMRMLAPS